MMTPVNRFRRIAPLGSDLPNSLEQGARQRAQTKCHRAKHPRHRHHQLLRGVDGRARTGFGERTEKSSGSAVISSTRCVVPRV